MIISERYGTYYLYLYQRGTGLAAGGLLYSVGGYSECRPFLSLRAHFAGCNSLQKREVPGGFGFRPVVSAVKIKIMLDKIVFLIICDGLQ